MSSSTSSYIRQKQRLHATHSFFSQGSPHGTCSFEMPKQSVSSIIWDSGAGLPIANGKTEIHGTCPYKHLKVKGVAEAIKVHGQETEVECAG